LYAGIFLVHLHLIRVQEFILQEDDMSSEQVLKYQSYKKWSRLRSVLQTLYLLTVPADTKLGYSYPCTVIKIFAFASSRVHGASDCPFRGTATHCLLHVAVG
jgi:hypothetical protein